MADTIWTYQKTMPAALVQKYSTSEGVEVAVYEAEGRFYFKQNGMQVTSVSYCAKETAVQKAFAVAFLGEEL